ncbi:MAG: UvrD-helicase domain-containing protein [Candidatus Pacebacteria bacterium]|nr:UvrD-helicase domain-containing protein [Candidatus Paceibacterota bacterium]
MFSDLLLGLNDEQKAAVLHGDGPAMVLAGAGSGKTRVLTTRVAYLTAEKHISPSAILLVTFTNKAAHEMTERVRKMTGHTLQFSGTFHKLCAKILRADGHWIGIPSNFLIFDGDDQLDLIKAILKQLKIPPKEANPRIVLSMISNAKTEMITPSEYWDVARGKYQELTAKVYQIYEKKLTEQHAVDFDNLLNKTVELFQKYRKVLEKYQNQFDHVLVDEYQDVNKAQYLLSKMLAEPENHLMVVGDFSQSIYAFRGADYRNMLLLKKDFPAIAEYKLERNYRSSQNILDAATGVILNNTTHPVLTLWTERQSEEKIVLFEAESDQEETLFVAQNIQEAMRTHNLSEIAVLYRTNAQSRVIEDICIRSGIPYRLVGGVRFYARKEIKDVLAYLRVFSNHKDEIAVGRLEKLGKRKFDAYIRWLNTEKHLPTAPLDILDKVIEVSQYKDLYDEKIEEDQSRLENIQELRSVASEFSTLTEFLEQVALVENDAASEKANAKNPNQSAVTLMSMHAAKGLEFGVVFMIGMEEGLFPHSRSLLDKHQLEEERRLCYVGITRAKEKLFLTYTRKRLLYGNITGSIVSRFIAEIPSHVLDKRGGAFLSHPTPTPKGRTFIPNDEAFEQFLTGEIDVDALLG